MDSIHAPPARKENGSDNVTVVTDEEERPIGLTGFKAYVEDLVRPAESKPCECSWPEPCPSGHAWSLVGQGMTFDTTIFMAKAVAAQFADAPSDVPAFVKAVFEEVFA